MRDSPFRISKFRNPERVVHQGAPFFVPPLYRYLPALVGSTNKGKYKVYHSISLVVNSGSSISSSVDSLVSNGAYFTRAFVHRPSLRLNSPPIKLKYPASDGVL